MPTLERIAYFQNRRDEVPNQELARELAEAKDKKGIAEIAGNLWHKNKNVRSDCLKVLYEIGYINPSLIADYVSEFLKLLRAKENRMVWGAMIGLATIADKRPKEIWQHIDEVEHVVDQGSVITVVWGVKTMARVSAADKKYRKKLFPILLTHLRKCIPRDVPMHAESILCTVDKNNEKEFLAVVNSRQEELTPSQRARLKKVMRTLEK